MNECSICLDTMQPHNISENNCGHQFCKGCIDSWLDDGKNTCPMCRQPIQYLTQNGETHRLIVKRIPPEEYRNQPTPIVQRGIHHSVKCVFLAMAFCSAIQIAFIHRLQNQNQDITDSYERCQSNNSILNHIIEDNHYIGVGPYEKYLIMDPDTSDFYVCNIPRYFVDHCFT